MILVSEDLYDNLTIQTRRRMVRVDSIKINGNSKNMDIYTIKINLSKIKADAK